MHGAPQAPGGAFPVPSQRPAVREVPARGAWGRCSKPLPPQAYLRLPPPLRTPQVLNVGERAPEGRASKSSQLRRARPGFFYANRFSSQKQRPAERPCFVFLLDFFTRSYKPAQCKVWAEKTPPGGWRAHRRRHRGGSRACDFLDHFWTCGVHAPWALRPCLSAARELQKTN